MVADVVQQHGAIKWCPDQAWPPGLHTTLKGQDTKTPSIEAQGSDFLSITSSELAGVTAVVLPAAVDDFIAGVLRGGGQADVTSPSAERVGLELSLTALCFCSGASKRLQSTLLKDTSPLRARAREIALSASALFAVSRS